MRAVAQAVREAASAGRCVIVGTRSVRDPRRARPMSCASSCTLRASGASPTSWRRRTSPARWPRPRSSASTGLRVAYIRQWYGLAFGDTRNYDLCIDTSRLEAVQSAARRSLRPCERACDARDSRCAIATFAYCGSDCSSPTSGRGCSSRRWDSSSRGWPARRIKPRSTSASSALPARCRCCCSRRWPASSPISFRGGASYS